MQGKGEGEVVREEVGGWVGGRAGWCRWRGGGAVGGGVRECRKPVMVMVVAGGAGWEVGGGWVGGGGLGGGAVVEWSVSSGGWGWGRGEGGGGGWRRWWCAGEGGKVRVGGRVVRMRVRVLFVVCALVLSLLFCFV